MTTSSQPYFPSQPHFATAPAVGVTHTVNGDRLVARMGMRIGAVAMALVGMLIWVAPGAGWEGDMMLFKLLVSICAFVTAAWFGEASLPPLPPVAEVDIEASELRLVREGAQGEARILERCAFVDLHYVELAGRRVTFWAEGNRLLAEVSLTNADLHARLLHGLRAANKLA